MPLPDPPSRSSRRRFLGAAIGLPLLAGLGWQFRPTTPPEFPERAPDGPRRPRLMVVYGSMMGGTAETAAWMADEARAAGIPVGLFRADTAPGPQDYDAVLMGSAIKASAWLPEMVGWAARHAEALAAMPAALFQTSMHCAGLTRMGRVPLDAAGRRVLLPTLGTLHAAVPALAQAPVAFLPGRLEFARLTPGLRLAYPIVSQSVLSGDFRNPDWTRDFARAQLGSAPFAQALAPRG